jgi:1-acyl-sn-glycerol-3-phosphate acyltransferase
MFRRDPFGHLLFIKRFLIRFIGRLTWRRYTRKNSITISGSEVLKSLPDRNVLFVSNHQTYFADVIAFLHVFCAAKNNQYDSIEDNSYLRHPRVNSYFVAAEETMRKGILPRIFAYVGSVTIQRTWKQGTQDVNRKVRMDDISNIGTALSDGWVINFPQGTTKPYAKGRRGVILILKKYNPIVVPVVIDGFRRAFDKKGLRLKKQGTPLSIRFKSPMNIDLNKPADDILAELMDAIEQSEKFQTGLPKPGND